MAKTAFSKEWLTEKGLVEISEGVYAHHEKSVIKTGGGQELLINDKVIMTTTIPLVFKEKINNVPEFEVKPVIEWFIPYQIPSKKTSQQLYIKRTKDGRQIPATTTSKRYKDYITVTRRYWEVFGLEFNRTLSKLAVLPPYKIEFTFTRSTQQVVDYVGPLESVQDIMQEFGWLKNDDYKNLKPILGDMEVNKSKPGVKIKLIP